MAPKTCPRDPSTGVAIGGKLDILPSKLCFRGCSHRGAPQLPFTHPPKELLDTNERLLDQNDTGTLGFYLNIFLSSPEDRRMSSFWLTESGLIHVTDVMTEYVLRMGRAIELAINSGKSDDEDRAGRAISVFLRMLSDPGILHDVPPMYHRALVECFDRAQAFHLRLDPVPRNPATALHQWKKLAEMLEGVTHFWGFDRLLTSLGSFQKPPVVHSSHAASVPDVKIETMVQPISICSAFDLRDLLYELYLETLAIVRIPEKEEVRLYTGWTPNSIEEDRGPAEVEFRDSIIDGDFADLLEPRTLPAEDYDELRALFVPLYEPEERDPLGIPRLLMPRFHADDLSLFVTVNKSICSSRGLMFWATLFILLGNGSM